MGVLISLVLLVSLFMSGDTKTASGRLYGGLIALNCLMLLVDSITWLLAGVPGAGARAAVCASNFVVYTCGVAIHLMFMRYLLSCIPGEGATLAHALAVTTALCVVLELLVIVSQYTGIIYQITPDNEFALGPMYWLYSGVMSLSYLWFFIVTLRSYRRQSLPARTFWLFNAFTALMVLAQWLEMAIDGLMANYAASTITLLLIFINVHWEKSRKLELETAHAQMATVLSQIQPHFLNNTLVAIERLCIHDPAQARQAVVEFSTYLRGNIDSLSQKAPIPFAKELSHVKLYLSLEKRRFGDRLNVVYDIEAEDFLLPALTLQPIVENAVKHGVTRRVEGGTVRISSRAREDGWQIVVEDDGMGFDTRAAAGVGLGSVRARMQTVLKGRMTVESTPGVGTRVTLIIPMEGGQACSSSPLTTKPRPSNR